VTETLYWSFDETQAERLERGLAFLLDVLFHR